MFRCITKLRALIIDVESFFDTDNVNWSILTENFKCLFIFTKNETERGIQENKLKCFVTHMENYMKLFVPNPSTHFEMLKLLNVEATEVAYISRDIGFLNRAMHFMGGTVWVTNAVSYAEASQAPDIICRDFNTMVQLLLENVKGFLGEIAVYPEMDKRGMIIPVRFEASGDTVPLYMMGRYFGQSHYMYQLHPYSASISLNKKNGRSYYRTYDEIFARLYISAVKRIQKGKQIDGFVSVPTRPGDTDRFDCIRERVASECGIEDLGRHFFCVKNYPTQKNLSSLERQSNIKDAFFYDGNLCGKNIIVIDDIITTGATMRECIQELNEKGASQIVIIALAVNQMQGSYWSADLAQVSCPNCGEKMQLLINSRTKNFFYRCYRCSRSIDFEWGRTLLCDWTNSERFDLGNGEIDNL